MTTGVVPDREQVGRALRAALSDAGVYRYEAAEHLGVCRNGLWRKLTGQAPISVDEFAAIADLTGQRVPALAGQVQAIADRDAGVLP
ncbi:MAG: hypothetical protein KDB60_07525 [Propionibacteriaceae bacterium]|nr:hypothetical protein [Propionibacteriaceae bacterium]